MKGNHLIIKLFILLMLAPQLGFTQYKSFFGKEMTSWNRELIGHDDLATDSINILASDTIRIDSLLYYKATHYINRNYQRSLFYYYREDTTKGRLYHYDTSTKTEFLVVDMSLNKGDTFHTNMSKDTMLADSVYYINGVKHILVSNGQFDRILFAEGVGTLDIIMISPRVVWKGGMDQLFLYCQFKDGQHVYKNHLNANYPYCNSMQNSVHDTNKGFTSVYPNPATDMLSIAFGNIGVYTVKLVNALGQSVLEEHVNHLNKVTYPINHLSDWIYTIIISDDNANKIYTEKVIIQK